MDDGVQQAYQIFLGELGYLSDGEIDLIKHAFDVALLAHGPARRKSGEPYIMHPLAVAGMLARMRMDSATLAAALLHDVLEDTAVPPKELRREFGEDIFRLVDSVTKVGKVRKLPKADLTYDQIEEASLVNLFVAMAADLRVIVIKLCDRLHNMYTIDALKPERRIEIAHETLDLFAPVAARLGIWSIKRELEDLSLSVIDPDSYAEIDQIVRARSQLLQQDLDDMLLQLRTRLADDGISAEVNPLPEHIYGLYRHIQELGWQSARTYDGFRIHVVVEAVAQCYAALGSVHSLWKPVPGRMVDFIAAPKDGLYRSLHVAVIGLRGYPLEVRIRTRQMRHVADYGVVAYIQHPPEGLWLAQPRPNVVWLKELKEWSNDGPSAFLELFKAQITPDRVQVFTPKGDMLELPVGATPVDFAYAVHTEVGHSCHKALVNGRFAPLNRPLCDGDQVEIIKSDMPLPNRAWLDLDLGYVGNAQSTLRYIRRWFARQPQAWLIEQGRSLIEEEVRCWAACDGWTVTEITRLARRCGLTIEEFCLRTGRGEISTSDLAIMVLSEVSGWDDGRPGLITLEVNAVDRPGLLRDICQVVAEDNVNMPSVSAVSSDEQCLARLRLTLSAKMIAQLVRVVHQLGRLQSVIRVQRVSLAWDGK